jgi:hypothetical protein
MAPRKKAKEDPREEVRPSVAEIEGENLFAQLAQKHWTSKKTSKVKVKPDVLKNEIWDVLEKEDFAFKSLLVLENLQILEKYGRPVWTYGALLTARIVTFGQATLRTHPTSTSYLSFSLRMLGLGNIYQHGVSNFESIQGISLSLNRLVYRQSCGILLHVSTNTLDDIRYYPIRHRENPPPFVHHQCVPIVG